MRKGFIEYIEITETNWGYIIFEDLAILVLFVMSLVGILGMALEFPHPISNLEKLGGIIAFFVMFVITTMFWRSIRESGESLDYYTKTKKVKVKLERE